MAKRRMRRYRRGRRRLRKKITALSKRISNENRMFRQKIMLKTDLVYSGTAAVQFIPFNVMLNFPTYAVASTGAYVQFASGTSPFLTTQNATNFVSLFNLFDMYKVDSLVVTFYPVTVAVQSATSAYPSVGTVESLYQRNDKDDCALMAAETNALNSARLPKRIEEYKPTKFYYKQPKATRHYWFNTGSVAATPGGTTTNQTQNGYSNPYGSMKFAIESLNGAVANAYIGTIYCCWDVIFKGTQDN